MPIEMPDTYYIVRLEVGQLAVDDTNAQYVGDALTGNLELIVLTDLSGAVHTFPTKRVVDLVYSTREARLLGLAMGINEKEKLRILEEDAVVLLYPEAAESLNAKRAGEARDKAKAAEERAAAQEASSKAGASSLLM